MVRQAFAFAGMMVLVGSLFGCGSGLSDDDAKLRCDQEKESNSANGCFTDAAATQCLSCYQQCGDQCTRSALCPSTYTCPN